MEPWTEFFKNEPMNTAVEAFRTTEGQRSLEGLLYDVVNFDDTPCIVAWDNINNKVGLFFGLVVSSNHFVQPRWKVLKVEVLFFFKIIILQSKLKETLKLLITISNHYLCFYPIWA